MGGTSESLDRGQPWSHTAEIDHRDDPAAAAAAAEEKPS
jgi:hypothetical protein